MSQAQNIPPYDDYSLALRVIASTFIAVPTVAVAIRLWYRKSIQKLWWDDLMVFLCLIVSDAVQALVIPSTLADVGENISKAITSARPMIAGYHLFVTAMTLLRLATLSTYAFFFSIRRPFKWTLWITAGIVVIWFIIMILEPWLACSPPSRRLESLKPNACGSNSFAWYMAQNAINFVMDLFILALPVPIIYSLQLSTKQKLQLVGIFLLGYTYAFISLARQILTLKNADSVALGGNPYMPFNNIPLIFLGLLEVPIGLLALSIMPIVGSYKKLKPRMETLWTRFKRSVPVPRRFRAQTSSNRGSDSDLLPSSYRIRVAALSTETTQSKEMHELWQFSNAHVSIGDMQKQPQLRQYLAV